MSSNTATSKMQKILTKNQIFNRSSDISELNGENFERIMNESLVKAINSIEREPVKEKHIRKLVIGTYKAKSGRFFWKMISRQRIREDLSICLKFCYILHKLLRDGHRQMALDSREHVSMLSSCADYWHYFDAEKCGVVNYHYSHMLISRTKFLCQNLSFPNDLKMNDELIDQADPVILFDICCEILDQAEEVLALVGHIHSNFEHRRLTSTSNAGKFTLAPIVPCVQDSYALYDYLVKILFKLFAKFDQTLLAGHLKRFNEIHDRLYQTQRKIRDLHYLKSFIQWPDFPAEPPNFANNSDLSRHNEATKLTVMEQLDFSGDFSVGDSVSCSSAALGDMLVDISEQPPSSSLSDLSLASTTTPTNDYDSPPASSVVSSISLVGSGQDDAARGADEDGADLVRANQLKLIEELENLVAALRSELAQLKQEHEFKLAHISSESEQRTTMHESELKKLKTELSNLRGDLNSTRKLLEEEKDKARLAVHKLEINEEVMKKLAKDTNELKKQKSAQVQAPAPAPTPTAVVVDKKAALELDAAQRRLAELAGKLEQQQAQLVELQNDKLALEQRLSKRQEDKSQCEMVEMETIIAEATRKLEELGDRARQLKAAACGADSKLQLEVNERISVVCASLMEAVRKLMVQSRRLQHEIVQLARQPEAPSAARQQTNGDQFYQKNSNWTEGLVSAANVVAMAAKSLVDTADRSMSGQVRFSELSAVANEIQAATMRLLMASRVRAPKDSDQLKQLSAAAKLVSECKATVVEAAHECDELIDGETGKLELGALSAHQTRRLEIETKAKIIELQTNLQREQEKLGRLNRLHYQQDGVAQTAAAAGATPTAL